MTDEDKVKAVLQSPEVLQAVKLLTAVFIDLDLKTHIHCGYDLSKGPENIMNFTLKFDRTDNNETLVKLCKDLALFTEPNGDVINGFRTQETIKKIKQLIT